MSRIEHYFENLLEYGKDVEGEPNKSQLSPEVAEAVEECALYIKLHSTVLLKHFNLDFDSDI